jgi:hypothetical protein
MAGRLRCKPLQNGLLIPPQTGLRFFTSLHLALEPNLRLTRLRRGFETTSNESVFDER